MDNRVESMTVLVVVVNYSLDHQHFKSSPTRYLSNPWNSSSDQQRHNFPRSPILLSTPFPAFYQILTHLFIMSECVSIPIPKAQWHNHPNQSLLSLLSTYFEGKKSLVPSHFYRFYWFCCHYPEGNVLSAPVSILITLKLRLKLR